ncbi:hypothetical protein BXY66_1773 [Shimia isoporae]|uniref:Major facilitator superfamily (MFS) profile domain-containing protein n=1 Tax=Shimia isoporae TaxID=647720 RepID=A0A4R1NMP4_9RHOB|nr:hypothetical protein [Shimia isoporae]TCL09716.1 hypothetical protein BXY66_1773 [Shimia isoporae]
MIVILGAIVGAISGGFLAKRRGGKRLDILQYAVIYAMIFAILGLFATLTIHRLSI